MQKLHLLPNISTSGVIPKSEMLTCGFTPSDIDSLLEAKVLTSFHIPELEQDCIALPCHSFPDQNYNELLQQYDQVQQQLDSCSTDRLKDEVRKATSQLKQAKMKLFQLSQQKKPSTKSPYEAEKHRLLHDYNDLRDFVHNQLQQIATARGVTVKTLYSEFDIDPDHDK
ncbi:hypothetical protein P9112_000470 [Eukaryota sp. TZLM1-RC]